MGFVLGADRRRLSAMREVDDVPSVERNLRPERPTDERFLSCADSSPSASSPLRSSSSSASCLAPSLTESGTESLATLESHLTGLHLWIWLGLTAAGLLVASAMAMLRRAPSGKNTRGGRSVPHDRRSPRLRGAPSPVPATAGDARRGPRSHGAPLRTSGRAARGRHPDLLCVPHPPVPGAPAARHRRTVSTATPRRGPRSSSASRSFPASSRSHSTPAWSRSHCCWSGCGRTAWQCCAPPKVVRRSRRDAPTPEAARL